MNTQAQNQLPLDTTAVADGKPSIQTIAISRALAMLKAVKAQYIIKLSDGTVLNEGDMQLAPPKPQKPARKCRTMRDPSVPFGSYSRYLKEQGLEAMQPGELLVVDALTFAPISLRNTASAWAVTHWGKQSCITNIKGNSLEIMRVA